MSLATQRNRLGREPVVIVELDLDYCPLTYGGGACTAAIGTTGAVKCYNTRSTCQVPPAYRANPATKTYRFSSVMLPAGAIQAIPSVLSYSPAPTVLDPAKSLGSRASVTVTLQDHPQSDHGIDKYVAERTYNSATTGTFWGKLIRRNKFYNGRIMRVRVGYLTNPVDFANFQTYVYVIDQISGPDSAGRVKIVGKDLLKLADDTRAQAPLANTGKLSADLSLLGTSATVVVTGSRTIDDEYAHSGTVRIGDECCDFTRAPASSTLTLLRGTHGTVAAAHSKDDSVQQCVVYTKRLVQDIVYDLLTVHGNVPTQYIDKTAWDAEAATWLPGKLSAVISKPMGVTELLNELTQQALFSIWWDERTQLVQFRALRPARFGETTPISDDNNVVSGSLATAEDPTLRISQVWVFYGLRSPTRDDTKAESYSQLAITADLDAEGADEYGDQRITQIMSRWFPVDGSATNANLLGNRLVYRYRNAPRTLTVKVDAKDALWTGDVAQVTSKVVQDDTGAPATTLFQVIAATETVPGHEFKLDMQDTFFKGRYGFIAPNTEGVYTASSDADRDLYAWACPGGWPSVTTAALFADGTEPYKII